ncbi:MAG: DUF4843 domain-containing protein [Odoribacteraceae bacterium]|jgi:hypothetical protein|nr:DUF4843 domain-containing protein [Odoribacteraceae bacterium]
MKTTWIFLSLCLALVACREEEVPLYNGEANSVNFFFEAASLGDSTARYTFVYEPLTTVEDTLWLELYTIGSVTNYPRPVSLRQLPSEEPRAVPGVHYVGLDDPRVAAAYTIPAGANRQLVPVILLRDASLADTTYSLLIGIEANAHFIAGPLANRKKQVVISDILARPAGWNALVNLLFSNYGPVTHRFMIDNAPEGIQVNEDFFTTQLNFLNTELFAYWRQYFYRKLAEENARRAALGLGPLREAPAVGQTEGRLVTFII